MQDEPLRVKSVQLNRPAQAKLSRKEFADAIRTAVPEGSILDDDEIISIALGQDPSVQDYLETQTETLKAEMGAPDPPSLDQPHRYNIPSPESARISGVREQGIQYLPEGLKGPARSFLKTATPFTQGIKEGITAGALPAEVAEGDSQGARVAGNVVGGIAATAPVAMSGSIPLMGALGAVQGATMATRTNLDKLERERQEAGAKTHEEGGLATYEPPSLLQTATPRGVMRVAGQAVVSGAANMLPFKFAGGPIANLLKSVGLAVPANMAPVAVDQAIDTGRVDPGDPEYRDAYRLTGAIGAGAGVAGSVAAGVMKPKPVERIPDQGPGPVYYDVPPKKPNDPTGGPKGPRWYGDPGPKQEGWKTVGDAVEIIPDPAQPGVKIRQVKHSQDANGIWQVEVRLHDGTTHAFTKPLTFFFSRTGKRVVIDPSKPPRSAAAPGAAGSGPSSPTAPPPGPAGLPAVPAALPEASPVPTATFKGWEPDGNGGSRPMFDVNGQPMELGALRANSIPVPDFPPLHLWQPAFTPEVQKGLMRDYTNVPPPAQPVVTDGVGEALRRKGFEAPLQTPSDDIQLMARSRGDSPSGFSPDLEQEIAYRRQMWQEAVNSGEAPPNDIAVNDDWNTFQLLKDVYSSDVPPSWKREIEDWWIAKGIYTEITKAERDARIRNGLNVRPGAFLQRGNRYFEFNEHPPRTKEPGPPDVSFARPISPEVQAIIDAENAKASGAHPDPADFRLGLGNRLKSQMEKVAPVEDGKVPGQAPPEVSKMAFWDWDKKNKPVDAIVTGTEEKVSITLPDDPTQLRKTLRSSLYTGDRAKTILTELLQNATDEVALSGTKNQNIDVEYKRTQSDPRSNVYDGFEIKVADQGRGMTPQQVKDHMLVLTGSGKRSDASASGGFGIAKAAFIDAADDFEMITVAQVGDQKVLTRLYGHPDDLRLSTEYVDPSTPTGTTVRSAIKLREGENTYGVDAAVDNVLLGAKLPKGTITVDQGWGPEVRSFTDVDSWQLMAEKDIPAAGGKVMIYQNPKGQTLKQTSLASAVLNNRLGTSIRATAGKWGGPELDLPDGDEIRVNIVPTVEEGDPTYPFTANRESLRDAASTAIRDFFQSVVYDPIYERWKNALNSFDQNMPTLGPSRHFPNEIAVMDPGGRLTPAEINSLRSLRGVRELADIIENVLVQIMDQAPGAFILRDRLKRTGLLFGDTADADKAKTRRGGSVGGAYGLYVTRKDSFDTIYTNPAALWQAAENILTRGLIQRPGTILDQTVDLPAMTASGLHHTILHELVHNTEKAHDTSFAYKVANVYQHLHPATQREQLNDLTRALSHPDFQEVLRIYREAEGRPDTRPNLLSGEYLRGEAAGGGAGRVPPSTPLGGEGLGAGKSPRFGDERGAVRPDLLVHTTAATVGGALGGLQGDSDDNFNWSMALIGAGIGLGASTTFRDYFRKIGKEQDIIKGLSSHPSINEAYRRLGPGSLAETDVKSAIRSAYEDILDNTFTPHALLQREGEAWSKANLGTGDPAYFQPAINILDKLTMDKFTIPPKVADQFKALIADVLKDDDSYERLLRITRLRADIEQRQNDLAKRNEAFTWLQNYRAAKAAGDPLTAAMWRQKLRANPGILKPLPPVMRGNVPPDHAVETLRRLEEEAFAHHPDVIQAANNWKAWGQGLLDEMEGAGINVDQLRIMNRDYSPNYDLSKIGKSGKISVGGPAGIGKSRSGYLKRRERQDPDQKIWMDIVGPFFKRTIDHSVDLAKKNAAKELLDLYDPYRNGTLPPDTPSVKPDGEYTYWEFAIPGENQKYGKEGGWLPIPVAAEVQRHYAPARGWQKAMDAINAPTKGFLIRASGGGFILNNFAGNTADMYFSTPVTQWPSLTHAGAQAIAATILEASAGPMRRAGISLRPDIQQMVDAFAGLSEQGRKAGIGTEAAAAEITSQALADPRIADKAIDPETPKGARAGRALVRPVTAYGRHFDNIRQATENVTRLAHFIHLVQNNGVEPKQAGRVVNMVQGNYNPTNQTIRERDIKRFAIFWTFYKNALPNWLPLLGREIAYGDEIHGGRGAARLKTLAPMGKKLAAVSAVGLAANLWNHLFFPDAEASLTDYQKEQFHILMPDFWNKDGAWDYEKQEWRLAYHGWPTPMNVAHRAVGLGGAQNRLLHAAKGTGSGDELERSWDQIKSFWGGVLVHPIAGVAGALFTGKDPISGQPVVEPGSTNWQAAMQIAQFPIKGLPGMRPLYTAAREAAEPGETAAHFVRRMLVGSTYQPLNRENQEVRALARAVAGGNRAANEKSQTARDVALFRGEQEQFTPEEITSIMTGKDKVSWKGKVVSLAKLPEFIAKSGEIKPSDPGAVDALIKSGKGTTVDPRKSGPVYLPTRDLIRAMGPDAALKEFLGSFQGDQRQGDAWRSGAVRIVQQLRNESKNWEIPASIMMMLQQAPSAEANTEILRRVLALEDQFDPQRQMGDQLGRKLFGQ
jgi:hypothetical protein